MSHCKAHAQASTCAGCGIGLCSYCDRPLTSPWARLIWPDRQLWRLCGPRCLAEATAALAEPASAAEEGGAIRQALASLAEVAAAQGAGRLDSRPADWQRLAAELRGLTR